MHVGQVVAAIFQPRTPETLKPGAHAFIGMPGTFEALWRIEEGEGPYAGEWAMHVPPHWRKVNNFVWVPSGDLINV